MSRKGVSFLSINSLRSLKSKVCFPTSPDSFKTLSFLRNFNTATQSSQLSSYGEYDHDYSDGSYQNRNRVSENFVTKPFREGLNPNEGFRGGHRTQLGNDPVRENGDFGGFNGNFHNVSSGLNTGFQQNGNFSGNHWNNNSWQIQSSAQSQYDIQNQPNSGFTGNNSQELAGDSPGTPIQGTLEEFDTFCKEGKVREVVEVLQLLEQRRVLVDLDRLFQLMSACGKAEALSEAKAVHNHVVRLLSPIEVDTQNKIIEMYSKCGSMDDALNVFNGMRERNLSSWVTMITWLAKNGLGEDAIDLFSQFKQTKQKPDEDMFVAVFLACKVVGDVTEGMLHFESMMKDYRIVPSVQHYISIVDMLGSNGYLDEALEFVEKMPIEPNLDIWKSLMTLSRVHGHAELGDRCFEIIEQLEPLCLDKQSREGLIPMNAIDPEKEVKKAQNILEITSKVHEYRAGDRSHPNSPLLYSLLRGLKQQMKEVGYIPDTKAVHHDIEQEGKEEALLSHSERLAVAHALLTSPARSTVRIIKNLRVCVDCHNAFKIIAKIVGREIISRDTKRFHHMKDGECSCRDYW